MSESPDAVVALALAAVAPRALGGVVVRGAPGPWSQALTSYAGSLAIDPRHVVVVPRAVSSEGLVGGLALAETLQTGLPVMGRGLLARADDGVLVVRAAERLEPDLAALIARSLDEGVVHSDDGRALRTEHARFWVLAFEDAPCRAADDGDVECLSEVLRCRLAFIGAPPARDHADRTDAWPTPARVIAARRRFSSVTVKEPLLSALVAMGPRLGAADVRTACMCVAAARAHAALHSRLSVSDEDAEVAVRLVYGPRARLLEPTTTDDEVQRPDDRTDNQTDDRSDDRSDDHSDDHSDEPHSDVPPPSSPSSSPSTEPPCERGVLDEREFKEAPPPSESAPTSSSTDTGVGEGASLRVAIPPELLQTLSASAASSKVSRGGGRRTRKSDATSHEGGRPIGAVSGLPSGRARLHAIATLAAAAPWQRLRKAEAKVPRLVHLRREDLRVRRMKRPMASCVIFCVDASGSLALRRLAEVRGAIEQVFLDCYVRRDAVALVTFRGDEASVVLPPTRALARARRALADLASGGTTPLASGLDVTASVVADVHRRGQRPCVVLLTDGRGNVARDGERGAGPARTDVVTAAAALVQQLEKARGSAIVLDTAARPRGDAAVLARWLQARYAPLPRVDAAHVARHVAVHLTTEHRLVENRAAAIGAAAHGAVENRVVLAARGGA